MKSAFFIFTLVASLVGLMYCEISDERLQYIYNHPNTEEHIKQLVERYTHAKRLRKCLAHFGSLSICQNNVTWFMWAQILAKEIMNGSY